MRYCTSCGEKSGHKICKSCGVKENREHKYCGWCGAPLNENAAVCTQCGCKVRPNKFLTALGTICGVIMLVIALLAFGAKSEGGANEFILAGILLAVGGMLCFPFVGNFIREKFFENKTAKNTLLVVRIIGAIVLFIAGIAFAFVAAAKSPSQDVYADEATEAALVIFHEEVQLKNESSFVVNDSKVYCGDKPYNGDENLRLVTVILDYSAQNGLGGNNRTTYTVKMIFDYASGAYYRCDDGTRINFR